MSCVSKRCRHTGTELCNTCKRMHNFQDHYSEYEPTCPHGYTDCILDPAYIFHHHPEWYKDLHGDAKPTDVACNDCTDGECYDDEDK